MKRKTSNGRVLLIEQDPLVREGLTALLRAWNFEVTGGAHPAAVVHAANLAQPDLAIIAEPAGDASLAAEWIATLRRQYRGLPVILIADHAAKIPCNVETEDCLMLESPVKVDALRRSVNAVIGTRAGVAR